MEKCYINGMGCVSGQKTFEGNFLENPIDYSNTNVIYAEKPKYKDYIPPAAIRRMSSGVKNSVVASSLALEEAGTNELEAIITGTGMGCIQDSEKFLGKMIEFNEQYLTPTSFIQSTHNTVGGQIALKLKCNAYNFTYVNTGGSFNSALMDGVMQVKDEGKNNVLIGGIDEIASHTFKLYQSISHIKQDSAEDGNIFANRSKGSSAGEGAVFFVLGNEKKENTFAEVADTDMINRLNVDDLNVYIQGFLDKNEVQLDDIDAVIFGNNGDEAFDPFYDEAEKLFVSSELLYFKHLFGEFMTSSAIAMWLATNIIKVQEIPSVLYKNRETNCKKEIRNVLVYNQYRGRDHSLILIKNV